MQLIRGALGMGRGGEDGAFVVSQRLQPGADIGGMVVPVLQMQAEVAAEEGRTEFGDEFLAGIAFIAEALVAHVPVEAEGMASC